MYILGLILFVFGCAGIIAGIRYITWGIDATTQFLVGGIALFFGRKIMRKANSTRNNKKNSFSYSQTQNLRTHTADNSQFLASTKNSSDRKKRTAENTVKTLSVEIIAGKSFSRYLNDLEKILHLIAREHRYSEIPVYIGVYKKDDKYCRVDFNLWDLPSLGNYIFGGSSLLVMDMLPLG